MVLLWLGARLVIDGDLTVGALICVQHAQRAGRYAHSEAVQFAVSSFHKMKVSIRRLASTSWMRYPEPTFEAARSLPHRYKGGDVRAREFQLRLICPRGAQGIFLLT